MGVIDVIPTDMTLEKMIYDKENSLRSPRYVLNLFNKLGNKHCALCNCEIPELIQGAHIWPVSSIKRAPALTLEQRLEYALDGDNGLWLCENHHKMFDEGMLTFDHHGQLLLKNGLERRHRKFIDEITKYDVLPDEFLIFVVSQPKNGRITIFNYCRKVIEYKMFRFEQAITKLDN